MMDIWIVKPSPSSCVDTGSSCSPATSDSPPESGGAHQGFAVKKSRNSR